MKRVWFAPAGSHCPSNDAAKALLRLTQLIITLLEECLYAISLARPS